VRRGPTVDRRKKLGVPPGGSFPFAPIAVGTPAREEMGGGRPPKDLSPPASTRRLAAASRCSIRSRHKRTPGAETPGVARCSHLLRCYPVVRGAATTGAAGAAAAAALA